MTDLHHHQERFSGVEEIACMVDVTPSGENSRRNVPGAPCRWPRKLRRSMKYLHPEESLQSLIVVLVASVLHRPTKFLRSATCSPGTGQTATRPSLQAISSTPLDPSWWWWRLVILVRPAYSAQAKGWDFSLSPSSGTSSQSPRRAKSQYLIGDRNFEGNVRRSPGLDRA